MFKEEFKKYMWDIFKKKNENNYWESFELLINLNIISYLNNFMDMFWKL